MIFVGGGWWMASQKSLQCNDLKSIENYWMIPKAVLVLSQVFQRDSCCGGDCVMYGGRECQFLETGVSAECTAVCKILDDTQQVYNISIWLQPHYEGTISVTEIELI